VIVDVHTHLPRYKESVSPEEVRYNTVARPDRAVRTPVTWGEYLEAMEPVDKAIVFGIARVRRGEGTDAAFSLENPNDAVYEFVQAHPERLTGFLSVDPNDPNALEEIERCVSDLDLKGIKMGPIYQDFDPLDERALAIYERAQVLYLPIILHQGTSYPREARLIRASVIAWDEVARRFPELKIILGHMAHPWQIDSIVVIRKQPNVYADVSALFYRPWSFYNCMRLATEWGVLHKLLFATDFPVATPEETMAGLRRVNSILEGTSLPRVPGEAIEEIIHRDSLSLLGVV